MTKQELARHAWYAQQIMHALDCPRSLSVSIMIKYEMWDEIANLRISASDYLDSESFFRAYQATKLLSKARWLPTTFDRTQVAKQKFEESEVRCRSTNELWRQYRLGKMKFLPNVERIISSVRRKIGTVLGDRLFEWTEYCDFGPGADGSTAGGMNSAYNKLSSPGSITINAYPYLDTFAEITSLCYIFVGDIETRKFRNIEITRGNRVTFVSKNAKTDRPIAIEPRWNIWMQKGLGAFLRKRLKRFGVNLDFQGLNQSLAIYSSNTSKYATIDLASASDTISREVIQAVMPEPWLDIFGSLRSPAYYLDGKWRTYEKWSSMGNGYTFELESLLFWAICSSIDDDISVYGDDLVVPTDSFETIVMALEVFGFEVNYLKSFSSGPFRESCGTDAFDGTNVTPIYWKEPLDEQGTLSLVNQLSVLATRLGFGSFRHPSLKPIWKKLFYELPKRFQQKGPSTLSSVCHDSRETWRCCTKYGWDGWFLNLFLPISRKYQFKEFIPAIISQNFQPSSDGYSVRDRVSWKKKTVFVPRGYVDVGPWGV